MAKADKGTRLALWGGARSGSTQLPGRAILLPSGAGGKYRYRRTLDIIDVGNGHMSGSGLCASSREKRGSREIC